MVAGVKAFYTCQPGMIRLRIGVLDPPHGVSVRHFSKVDLGGRKGWRAVTSGLMFVGMAGPCRDQGCNAMKSIRRCRLQILSNSLQCQPSKVAKSPKLAYCVKTYFEGLRRIHPLIQK